MSSSRGDSLHIGESVKSERAAIARMSRLSGAHWLALVMSLMLTLGAWYFTSLQVETQATGRFERYSSQVLDLVQERLTRYEDALASGIAAVHASGGDMSHAQWREFTGKLQIETKYPGINGMGIIYKVAREQADNHTKKHRVAQPGFAIHPVHDYDTLYPITYIEPAGENSVALGLDMAHEVNRLTATLQARDTGLPQITGPIVLVQDAQKTPGFLFFMPFYRGDSAASLAERQENFVGMVYAPFVFRKLMKGILEKENRLVHFSLRDGDETLYSEAGTEHDYAESPLRTTRHVAVYGRTWTFDIWTTPEFQTANRSNEPVMILIGGLTIDALLLCLFLLLAHSNQRALRFADQMTEEADSRAASLKRSNEDLERFASVASHDLKTPLRGIGFLADCIRDDIEQMGDAFENTDIEDNLSALEQQVHRMENLISGILNYSSVDASPQQPEQVTIATMVPALCAMAGLQPHQYRVTGDTAAFTTDVVRLEQVFQNLIENAVKYHPDPASLNLAIHTKDRGEWLTFSVSDNGKGIDPRYHGKIFEIFQTLTKENPATSTGIGLAIVQKIVQGVGGEIRLTSEVGHGCSFSFDWPKTLGTATFEQEAA